MPTPPCAAAARQLDAGVGQLLRGACGLASARARSAIASSRPRPAHSASSSAGQPLGASSRSAIITAAPSSTRIRGVAGLVIVGGGRERHQNRADAGRRQLRDGQRAGAADHQIGPAVGLGHVLDERLQPRAHAGLGVVALRRLEPALAGLMPHFERLHAPPRAPARTARSRSGAPHPGCRRRTSSADRTLALREALRRRRQLRRSRAAPDCRPPAHACRGAKLPGKAVSTRRARCARQRLVKPAIAFCS